MRSRELGFLGPGDPTRTRAPRAGVRRRLRGAAGAPRRPRCCDLGAGGGVPGLVLALAWPSTRVVLLEASARRCGFLREAVAVLGCEDRVRGGRGPGRGVSHGPGARGTVRLVTATLLRAPRGDRGVRRQAPSPARGLLMVVRAPERRAPGRRADAPTLAGGWPGTPRARGGRGAPRGSPAGGCPAPGGLRRALSPAATACPLASALLRRAAGRRGRPRRFHGATRAGRGRPHRHRHAGSRPLSARSLDGRIRSGLNDPVTPRHTLRLR